MGHGCSVEADAADSRHPYIFFLDRENRDHFDTLASADAKALPSFRNLRVSTLMQFLRGNHRNPFLEMHSRQYYEDLLANVIDDKATYDMLQMFERLHLTSSDMETCYLGLASAKNNIISHYNHEDIVPIIMAMRCYPGNLAGAYDYPGSDIILIARDYNHESIRHLLYTIHDVISVMSYIKMDELYSVKITVPINEGTTYEGTHHHASLPHHDSPRMYKFFKPLFYPMSFVDLASNVRLNKSTIAMELLQIACLALMQLSDLAMVCKEYGYALSLLQHQFSCCTIISAITGRGAFFQCDSYTHVMTQWQMATCYYHICNLLQEGENESIREEYLIFNRRVGSAANINENHKANYTRTNIELDHLNEVFDKFRQAGFETAEEIKNENVTTWPNCIIKAAKLSMIFFEMINLSTDWHRSVYQDASVHLIYCHNLLKKVIHEHTQVDDEIGDNEDNEFVNGRFLAKIDDCIGTLDALLSKLGGQYKSAQNGDLYLMALLLLLKALRHKAVFFSVREVNIRGHIFRDARMRQDEVNVYYKMRSVLNEICSELKSLNGMSDELKEFFRKINLFCISQRVFIQIEMAARVKNYDAAFWSLLSSVSIVDNMDKVNLKLFQKLKSMAKDALERQVQAQYRPNLQLQQNRLDRYNRRRLGSARPRQSTEADQPEHESEDDPLYSENTDPQEHDSQDESYSENTDQQELESEDDRSYSENTDLAYIFLFGLSTVSLMQYSDSLKKNNVELNEKLMGRATYYNGALAMLYKANPHYSDVILEPILDNVIISLIYYMSDVSDDLQHFDRISLVIRRLLIALPFMWEMCIRDKVFGGPVNYPEVHHKKIVLPVKCSEFKPYEISVRDNCLAILKVIPPSECYLEKDYSSYQYQSYKDTIDLQIEISRNIAQCGKEYLQWPDADKLILVNARNIANSIAKVIVMKDQMECKDTRVQQTSIFVNTLTDCMVKLSYTENGTCAPMATTLAILCGLVSAYFCCRKDVLMSDDDIDDKARGIINELFELMIVPNDSFEEIVDCFESRDDSSTLDDENTLCDILNYKRATAEIRPPYFSVPFSLEKGENVKISQRLLELKFLETARKFEKYASHCRKNEWESILRTGILALNVNRLVGYLQFGDPMQNSVNEKSFAGELRCIFQAVTGQYAYKSHEQRYENRIDSAADLIAKCIVENINGTFDESKACDTLKLYDSGERPFVTARVNYKLDEVNETKILTDRLEEYHVNEEIRFDRTDALYSQDLFDEMLKLDFEGNGLYRTGTALTRMNHFLHDMMDTLLSTAKNIHEKDGNRSCSGLFVNNTLLTRLQTLIDELNSEEFSELQRLTVILFRLDRLFNSGKYSSHLRGELFQPNPDESPRILPPVISTREDSVSVESRWSNV